MNRLILAALILAAGLVSHPVVSHALSARFQPPTHLVEIDWIDTTWRPS